MLQPSDQNITSTDPSDFDMCPVVGLLVDIDFTFSSTPKTSHKNWKLEIENKQTTKCYYLHYFCNKRVV